MKTPAIRSVLLAVGTAAAVAAGTTVAAGPTAASPAARSGRAASPAATTAAPTTTASSSPSTTRPSGSPTTTKCPSGPSTTAYPPGTVVSAWSFDTGGAPAGWSWTTGASGAVVPGAGTNGSGALQVGGLDSQRRVAVRVDTRGWGPFVITAEVRADGALPAVVSILGNQVARQRVVLDPAGFVEVKATFEAGTMYADWYCNGTMTGGRFPYSVTLEFAVETRCGDLDPARTLLIDDVSVVKARIGGTPRVRPAATTAAATPTASATSPTSTTRTTSPASTTSTTSATPTTSTTSASPTSSPTLSCPAPTTTSKSPRTTTSKKPSTKPSTSKKPAPIKCKVSLGSVNAWPGGWSAAVSVANVGPKDITPWTLTATLAQGQTLAYGWPATFTQQGTLLTGTPASFDTTLKGKSKVQWGVVLSGSQSAPTAWSVNGTRCVVG